MNNNNISKLFPKEDIIIPKLNVVLGKEEPDRICSCCEKYSHIELIDENQIKINIWRGSCCCCISYGFISKLCCLFQSFYCYKTMITNKMNIVDIAYINNFNRNGEDYYYYPLLVLDNRCLIIIGPSQDKYDVEMWCNELRKKLKLPESDNYEIPFNYRDQIL